MTPLRYAAVIGSVALLPACAVEPQWTVTGVWVNSPIRTDALYHLVLEQHGTAISGTLCGTSSVLFLTGAQVSGEFPEFTVSVRPENVRFGSPSPYEGKVFDENKVFLYSVGVNGVLTRFPNEFHRSSDQQFECPPVSALK